MNLRTILIPALLGMSVNSAMAQQRTCDMSVTLLEPATSAVINAYAQYNLRVNIANLGPDSLFVGDTLYYNKPTQPLFDYSTYILTQPINPGDNINLTLETLNNVNDDTQDQIMDYYVFVVSNPANTGRFIDTTLDGNNYDVNANVTFRAGNPTSINDVAKQKIAVKVFPNPASTAIQFSTAADNKVTAAFISDVTGREVQKLALQQGAAQQADISKLSPGLYLLRLDTEQGRATTKFIKK